MKNTVTDIRTYMSINNKTEFCLDTNVLYWYTYPRYTLTESSGRLKQVQYYYDFVDHLVADGNPLITTRYNISELINIIEKHEYDIFCKANPGVPYTKKDFRRISKERKALQKILTTTLNNVTSTCKVMDFNFTEESLASCVNTLDKHRCDVFDFMILDYYKEMGHLNIISDDSDFDSVSDIHLFTANQISLLKK